MHMTAIGRCVAAKSAAHSGMPVGRKRLQIPSLLSRSTRCIRRQLWRPRMRLLSIEHFGDCLAFVRCQDRYKDQRSDSLVCVRGYHCGRTVPYKHHAAMRAFECAIEGCRVIRQGRQGYWACRNFSPLHINGRMMSFQLEPSARAPCTKTTLMLPFDPVMIDPD